MKFALIGCGRIAQNHLSAASENQLELAALCDWVPGKAKALLRESAYAKDLQKVRIYHDYSELLRSEPDVDFVSIATDSGSHAQIALEVVRKGISVLIEKPMALSLADADEIMEAAQKNNAQVCVCHQNRFNTAVQEVKKALHEKKIGKISHAALCVRWHRDERYYAQDAWRGTWEKDGGCLMNQCIHGIDLLRWLLGGELTEVSGYIKKRAHIQTACEDVGMAVFSFADGTIASVEGTVNVFDRDDEETITFFGDKGVIQLGGLCANQINIWRVSEASEPQPMKPYREVKNVYGNGHTSVYADMMRAVRERTAPYVDGAAGKEALEAVLAIYASAKAGKPVALPLSGGTQTTDFISLSLE